MSHPGGNITGIANLAVDLGPKRLQLLRELVPAATILTALVNPTRKDANAEIKALRAAAAVLGAELQIVNASREDDFDAVFVALGQAKAAALMISGDPFFNSRSAHLAALGLRHGIPAVYQFPEFTAAGGLISYGSSITDTHRLAGIYVGRVLKGEKPADLPVQQSSKVELIINLRTARAIGIDIPTSLLLRADQVIE